MTALMLSESRAPSRMASIGHRWTQLGLGKIKTMRLPVMLLVAKKIPLRLTPQGFKACFFSNESPW